MITFFQHILTTSVSYFEFYAVMIFIWHNSIGGRVTCTCLLIIYAFIPTSLGLRQRFVLSLVLSFLLRGCMVYVNKIIPLIKSSSVNFVLHFPTHLSLALYLHTPSCCISCLLVIRFEATSEAAIFVWCWTTILIWLCLYFRK